MADIVRWPRRALSRPASQTTDEVVGFRAWADPLHVFNNRKLLHVAGVLAQWLEQSTADR